MGQSTVSATAPPNPEAATPALETRVRGFVARHLGIHADQLVGYLSRLDGLAGEPDLPTVRVRTSLVRRDTRSGRLGRAFPLNPYTLQVLIDDARRAGRGARLDVVVGQNTPVVLIDAIRRRLVALERRGVRVRVRLERRRRDPSVFLGL
ncbi:MAG TPA: hypothetical protein VKH82_17655 [Candidatus Binatia bacterium]|nr:hypothetical protein [Candidatus Binatia bacterium]